MTNTQVSHIKRKDYEPWTLTPSPRREADLQTRQYRRSGTLSRRFGDCRGHVLLARFDHMFAFSNGIDPPVDAPVQMSVCNRYPATLSVSVASGPTPAALPSTANRPLRMAGNALVASRTERLHGEAIPGDDGDAGDQTGRGEGSSETGPPGPERTRERPVNGRRPGSRA